MRVVAAIIIALSFMFSPRTAAAQEQVCKKAESNLQLKAWLDAIDEALHKVKINQVKMSMAEVSETIMPCMGEVIHPKYLAHYAQLQAVLFNIEMDDLGVIQWGQLALVADPGIDWERIPSLKLIKQTLDAEGAPALSGPANKGIAPPKKGAIFLNGQLLTEARGYVEVQGFIQVADKKGAIIENRWQDGVAFADHLLGPVTKIKAPKWYVPPSDQPVAVAVTETTSEALPTAPIPPKAPRNISSKKLLAGGGVGVVAASLYLVASLSAKGMADAQSVDELVSTRSKTNLMVVGSGALGVAAVGIGVTAFVSNGPGLGFSVEF